MADETVINLVKDLTTTLSSLADEFGTRAGRLLPELDDAQHDGPNTRRRLAEQLLARRQARFNYFPADLFHEPAWDMLLALYLAHDDGRLMNVKALVASASAPATTSQRWIEHLAKLKLVDRVVDPDDRRRIEVSLSGTGVDSVEAYLDRLATL